MDTKDMHMAVCDENYQLWEGEVGVLQPLTEAGF